jgi:hypothetical protein
MHPPGVVEQQAHDLWRTAFHDHRERLLAATEAVVRRCDSALPMLPPSLLAEPLTVSRWDRFVREEQLQPKRKGTAIEVLARRVRNALDGPNTRKMQLVVEAWLPEEPALCWVARASQDAVFQWFNEDAGQLAYMVLRPPFAARVAGGENDCAFECALECARSMLGEERVRPARDALDRGATRECARALSTELRAWRATATDDSEEAREVAQNREQVALFLAQSFEGVARGNGTSALSQYSEARSWCRIAAIDVSLVAESAIVRRYYDAPDVEAWIAKR